MGLEPTTSSLGSWHSTIELRPLTSTIIVTADGSGQSNHLFLKQEAKSENDGTNVGQDYS